MVVLSDLLGHCDGPEQPVFGDARVEVVDLDGRIKLIRCVDVQSDERERAGAAPIVVADVAVHEA
jgi:hypothetical protein